MDKTTLERFCNEGLTQREIAQITGTSQTTARYWLMKHGLSTNPASRHPADWLSLGFEDACTNALSIGEVLETIGVSKCASNYARARRLSEREGIPLPDWRVTKSQSVRQMGKSKLSEEEVRSRFRILEKTGSNHSYKRWMKSLFGVPDECAECGMGNTWMGKPITLELDHVNGDRPDYRFFNLRLLCPNCHSQAPTSNRRSSYDGYASA